jgi:hypothetical protein
MLVGPDLVSVATAMADPLRSRLLALLADGRVWTADALAETAAVPDDCCRFHLDRLAQARLIIPAHHGHRRTYQLTQPRAPRVLAALALAARDQPQPVHDGVGAYCGDHLGGSLGACLTAAMESGRLLVRSAGAYRPTTRGEAAFAGLDLQSMRRARGPLAIACVDADSQVHLGGSLGAAVAACLVARGWLTHASDRTVHVTSAGRSLLAEALTSPFALTFSMPIEEQRS